MSSSKNLNVNALAEVYKLIHTREQTDFDVKGSEFMYGESLC